MKMLSLVKVSDLDSSCIYHTCKIKAFPSHPHPLITDDVKASSGRRLGSNGLKMRDIGAKWGVTSLV